MTAAARVSAAAVRMTTPCIDEAAPRASISIDPHGGAVRALVGSLASPAAAVASEPATRCRFLVRVAPVAGRSGLEAGRAVAGVLPAAAGAHVYRAAIVGFVAALTPGEVDALRRDPRVRSVEPDRRVEVTVAGPAPSWGLDRIDQPGLPLSGTFEHDPAGGAGVRAYVIDTGVRATHAEFGGRVASGAGFVPGSSSTDDCNGHGTHVAGTLAGATMGIARAATIVPVRVLDCGGSGWDSMVISGLDWVIADHAAGTPAVANLSIGGPAASALNDAVSATVADGVAVAVAAGNESGTDACTRSPAGATAALTVGATTSTDARASYSNIGACLDLFAPGSAITSAWSTSDSATATLSGTSMATPHVAGIAAVLFGRDPGAAATAIEAAVLANATPGVVTNAGSGSPTLLARLPPPTGGPQQLFLAPFEAYVVDGPEPLAPVATSGRTVTVTSTTPAVCTTSGTAGSTLVPVAAGTCTLRLSVSGGDGWDPATATVSGPVYRAHQTIVVANAWAELPYGATVDAGATATSGLPVTLVSPGTTCALSGTTIRGDEVGDCTITALQGGNGDYGPAAPVTFTRSVAPAAQTIGLPAVTSVGVGTTTAYAPSVPSGLPVAAATLSPATCSIAPGTLTGLTTGDCLLRFTQDGAAGIRPTGATSVRPLTSASPWLTRLTLRPDGRPVIAYSIDQVVHLVLCDDSACTTRRDLTIATGSSRIRDLAVTLVGERPLVAATVWFDGAHAIACADADCTATSDVRLESGPLDTVSALVGADGRPVIAWDAAAGGIRLAFCGDATCASATRRTIATTTGDRGVAPALALAPGGRIAIAYHRGIWDAAGNLQRDGSLVVARCADATCGSLTTSAVDVSVASLKPAIVIPADDRPLVFWVDNSGLADQTLAYRALRARCDDPACSTLTAGVLDDDGLATENGSGWPTVGFDLSATLGADGLARVGYLKWLRMTPWTWSSQTIQWGAMVATCLDADCAASRHVALDEWSRTSWWYFHATTMPVAVRADGTLVSAYGFFPGAFTSADPTVVGLRLATCDAGACGTAARVVVVDARTASSLAYGGATVANPGAAVTLQATLRSSSGTLLASRRVRFTLAGATYEAVTNAKGVASTTATAPTDPGAWTVGVAWAGDASTAPTAATASLLVRTPTTLGSIGPAGASRSGSIRLTATLRTAAGPVAGATVTFTLGGKKVTATTDANGVALTAAITAPAKAGSYSITVSYAGGTTTVASSATGTLVVG